MQKAQSRPDLVREVIRKCSATEYSRRFRRCAAVSTSRKVLATAAREQSSQLAKALQTCSPAIAWHAPARDLPFMRRSRACRDCWWRAFPPRIGSGGRHCEVPLDEAAFATLGAVALHGIRTAEAKLGDMVAVIGLGLLGQLTVQLLKAAGCRVVGMDIDPSALIWPGRWARMALPIRRQRFAISALKRRAVRELTPF